MLRKAPLRRECRVATPVIVNTLFIFFPPPPKKNKSQSRLLLLLFCAENHLSASPDDVTAWISYAQMVKRPLKDETVVGRLQPGVSASSDVSVSKESIFRARRVLHRAIVITVAEEQKQKHDGGSTSKPRGDNILRHGRLLQALGLVRTRSWLKKGGGGFRFRFRFRFWFRFRFPPAAEVFPVVTD